MLLCWTLLQLSSQAILERSIRYSVFGGTRPPVIFPGVEATLRLQCWRLASTKGVVFSSISEWPGISKASALMAVAQIPHLAASAERCPDLDELGPYETQSAPTVR